MCGFPLYHNHLSIEAVVPVFGFGHPSMGKIVDSYRQIMFDEVLASDHRGLIFTFVLAFDLKSDVAYLERLRDKFLASGGQVFFEELYASLEERVKRNGGKDRLDQKPSKRDLVSSNQHLRDVDKKYQLNSPGDFPIEGNYLKIDTQKLNAGEAAQAIQRFIGS